MCTVSPVADIDVTKHEVRKVSTKHTLPSRVSPPCCVPSMDRVHYSKHRSSWSRMDLDDYTSTYSHAGPRESRREVLDFFGDRCRSFVSRCEQRKHPHEPCRTYYFPPRRSLILLGQHGACLTTSRTGLRRTYRATFRRSSASNCYRFSPRPRERSRN